MEDKKGRVEEVRISGEGVISGIKEKLKVEEVKVEGEELVKKVKELVRQGNIRRIIIKDKDGNTYFEIPLTIGVVAAVLLPIWVALGAIAALATNFVIVVERIEG